MAISKEWLQEWLPHAPWQGMPVPRFLPGWRESLSLTAASEKLQRSKAAPAFIKKFYASIAPVQERGERFSAGLRRGVEREVVKHYGLDSLLPQAPRDGPPVPRALPGWPEGIKKILGR